jgi:3-deoxy-D-manno-octulosonate 8-phosphate phosphatase (KDO 8-P phosphatase)
MPTLAKRCSAIELLVLDVDGVLTNGGIMLAGFDLEIKTFNTLDGAGLKCWHRAGKRAAIVTGRDSPALKRRAGEIGIEFVVPNAEDKRAALHSILAKTGLKFEQTAGMGDDLPDLPLLFDTGLALAAVDACPEVRHAAHYVTQKPGGSGAAREAIELILRCQGRWLR